MLTIAECGERWRDAERLQSESFGAQWDVAPTALAVYGTSGTQELADVLDGSVDTVHNLAKAQRMWEYIISGFMVLMGDPRREYGYMRFAKMWNKHERYELSPTDCLDFILSDMSDSGMEALIEEIHNPIPEWRRRFDNRPARKWLDKIATEPDPDQSPKITRAARLLKGRIEAEK